MNWTLEVVRVPVSDVDRAKEFYATGLGFAVDFDSTIGDVRIAQLTPPGSGCSILLGPAEGMEPGSLRGLQLVVSDVRAARAALVARGVDVGDVQVYGRDGSRRPARDDDELNNVGVLFLTDPDGNTWAVQQIDARAGTGAPSYVELGVPDVPRALTFYAAVLGWPADPAGGEIVTPTLRIGVHGGDPGAHFEVFFRVPDLDGALAAVGTAGGTAGEAHDSPGFGRWAECTDDQGVRFGLRQDPRA